MEHPTLEADSPSASQNSPGETTNILLVDDRAEDLLVLETILSDLGQNLVKAASGADALRHLLKQDFAVILLDVQMPLMNGYETATLIRERDRSQHTPIIFLTAGGKSETEVFQGYSVGAVDYVFKPIAPEILKAKVRVFIDLYRMADQVKRQARELAEANQELAQEVERRKQMEEEMRALSLVDELTGLYNRRGFMIVGRQELKMAERLGKNVELFFGDLDGLKTINDTLGHFEGDCALKEMANLLRGTCRESDVLARIGGDEFVILALEHSGQPERLIARLQAHLESRNANPGMRYPLGISMGIARFDANAPCSLEELMTRADGLMYEQKMAKKHTERSVARETQHAI